MMENEITKHGARAVLKLKTDLTALVVQEIKPRIKALVDEGILELEVDLSQTELIDSVGIGLLVSSHNSLSHMGGKLLISHASLDLIGLFKSMRLDYHFSIAGS